MKCKSIKERIIISSNVLNVPFFSPALLIIRFDTQELWLVSRTGSRSRFSCGRLGMLLDLEGERDLKVLEFSQSMIYLCIRKRLDQKLEFFQDIRRSSSEMECVDIPRDGGESCQNAYPKNKISFLYFYSSSF